MSVFSFGAITDVQYADADDAWNYQKTVVRRYRESMLGLVKGIEAWNRLWTAETRKFAFVVQLGDLLDGLCKTRKTTDRVMAQLEAELSQFAGYGQDASHHIHHCLGNHELYNMTRKEIKSTFLFNKNTIQNPHERMYYSFQPAPGYKCIILDAYDISIIGPSKDSASEAALYKQLHHISVSDSAPMEKDKDLDLDLVREMCFAFLSKNNPNDLRGAEDWTLSLLGLDRRFVPYNGAYSQSQMRWLVDELYAAEQAREKVILFGHANFHPGQGEHPGCLAWNYDVVLDILSLFADTVLFTLSGHFHRGAYHQQRVPAHGLSPFSHLLPADRKSQIESFKQDVPSIFSQTSKYQYEPKHNGKYIANSTATTRPVHHLVLRAPIECSPPESCYSTFHVYTDRVELVGNLEMEPKAFVF